LQVLLTRRIEPVERNGQSLDQMNVIAKITFGGALHLRTLDEKRGYKGTLLSAYPGDLIISKIRVAQGSLCIVADDLDHLAVSPEYPVYALDQRRVRSKFLRLIISSMPFRSRVSALRSGNTSKARIKPSDFEALPIPLPSLAEQDALVTAYAAAQDHAAELERDARAAETAAWHAFEDALGLAAPPPLPERPLFIARFKDMERWSHEGALRANLPAAASGVGSAPLVRLGDVVADLENGWSPKCHDRPAGPERWGVLKVGAVSFGTFDPNQNKELPDPLRPIHRHEVRAGDVLISRANVVRYVGACAYVHATRPSLMLCDKLFRVRFFQQTLLLPQFLAEAMRLSGVREQIETRLTGTSPTMKNISKPALLDLRLPLPSLEAQGGLVDALHSQRKAATAKRADAAALRQSAWSAFEAALFEPDPGASGDA
jgi:type I restriction enzyme, S subunit